MAGVSSRSPMYCATILNDTEPGVDDAQIPDVLIRSQSLYLVDKRNVCQPPLSRSEGHKGDVLFCVTLTLGTLIGVLFGRVIPERFRQIVYSPDQLQKERDEDYSISFSHSYFGSNYRTTMD
jgi:hypothetical protein